MASFWKQNLFLILFFFSLTGATVFSFVDQGQDEKPSVPLSKILASPKDFKTIESEGGERRPASAANAPVQKVSAQKLPLKIFCGQNQSGHKISQQLISLDVATCADVKEKNSLWIKNETNGFKAQVFKVDGSNFKTDFIQLNKGLNKILIEGITKNGQKLVQTLEIESGS